MQDVICRLSKVSVLGEFRLSVTLFLSVKSSKFAQYIESSLMRILNTFKVGFVKAVFPFFANLCLLPLLKNGQIDFPKQRALTKVKHLLLACQILRNFTEENARKFTENSLCCLCLC